MISMRTGTDGAGGSEAGRNGKRTRMMAALLAGAFLSLMAETFLNNALPTIMKDFAVSQSTAQWLSTAYLLVVGLMIPISAWIFSSFQSRTTYMAMMAVFLLGSLVCVFSTGHFALLLTGRIIQAAAAGSLMPFIQNVVLLLFPPERRGLALGVVGLVVALGPTVGPTMSAVSFCSIGPGALCSSFWLRSVCSCCSPPSSSYTRSTSRGRQSLIWFR